MANDPFAKFMHGLPEPQLSDIAAFKPFKIPTNKVAKAKLPAVKRTTRTPLKEIQPVSETVIPEVKLDVAKRRAAPVSNAAPSNAQLARRKATLTDPKSSIVMRDPAALIRERDTADLQPSKFERPTLASMQRDRAAEAKAGRQRATTPALLAELFPMVTPDAIHYAALHWGVNEDFLTSELINGFMAYYPSGMSAIDFYVLLKDYLEPLRSQSILAVSNQVTDPDAYKPEDAKEDEVDKETSTSLPGAPEQIRQWTPIITEVASNSGISGPELANFTALVGAIIYGESGGNKNAAGDLNIGGSYGLLQLYTNGGQGDGHTPEELKDPYKNLSIGVPYIVQAWKEVMADPEITNWRDRLYEIMARSGHPSRKGLQERPEFFQLVYQQFSNYLQGASTTNPENTEFMASDSLDAPFDGDFPITSYFGANDVAERKGAHTGMDWGMPMNTPIKNVLPGKVVNVGVNGGFGLEVVVEVNIGGDKHYLQYAHLTSADVTVGQMIQQGGIVGSSGGANGDSRDGTSTGAHLHFGVKDPSGQWIDPSKFLRGRAYLVEQTGMTAEDVVAKVGWSEQYLEEMIQRYVNGDAPKPEWRDNMRNLIIELHHWNTGFTAQPQVRDMGSSDNPMGDEGYKVGASENKFRDVQPGKSLVDTGQTFHSEEEIQAVTEKFMDLGRKLTPEEEQVFLNTIEFGDPILSNVAQKAWRVYVDRHIQELAEQGITGVDDDLTKFGLPSGMPTENASVTNDPFMTSRAREIDNRDPLQGLMDKYYEDALHPTQRVLFGPVMHSMSQLSNDLYGGEGPKDLLSLLTLLPVVNLPAAVKKIYDEVEAGNYDTAIADAIFTVGLGSVLSPAVANIPRQIADGDHPYIPKVNESIPDFNERTAKQWDSEVDPLKMRDVIEVGGDPLNFTSYKTFAAAYVATEGITPTSSIMGGLALLGPVGKALSKNEMFIDNIADPVIGKVTRRSFDSMEALVGQDVRQRAENILINKFPGIVNGSEKPTPEQIMAAFEEAAKALDPTAPIDKSAHKFQATLNRIIPGGERQRTLNRQLLGDVLEKVEKRDEKLRLVSGPEPGMHPKAFHKTDPFGRPIKQYKRVGTEPVSKKTHRRVPGEGTFTEEEILTRGTYRSGRHVAPPEGAVDDALMSFDRRVKLGLPTSKIVNDVEIPLGALPDERVATTFREPIGTKALLKNMSDAKALRTQDDIINMHRAGALNEDQAVVAYVRAWVGGADAAEISTILARKVGKSGKTVDEMLRAEIRARKNTALIDIIKGSGEATVDGMLGTIEKHAREVWRANNDDMIALMRERHNKIAQFALNSMDSAYKNGYKRTLGPLLGASSRAILGFPGYAVGNALEDFTQGVLHGGGGGLSRTRSRLNRKLEIWFGEGWRTNPLIPEDIKRMMKEPQIGKTGVVMRDFEVNAPWYKRAINQFRTSDVDPVGAQTQAEYINSVAKKARNDLKKAGNDFTMQSAADFLTMASGSDFWINTSRKWSHRVRADYALHNYERQLGRMMRETYHLRSEQYKKAIRNARDILPTNMSTKVRSEVMQMFDAAMFDDDPVAAIERIKTRFGEDQLRARTLQEFFSKDETFATIPINSRGLLWEMISGTDGKAKDMSVEEFVAAVNGPFRQSVHAEQVMQAAHSISQITPEVERLGAQISLSDMGEEDVLNFFTDLRRTHMTIADIPHYAHTQAANAAAIMPESAEAIWNAADNEIITQYEQLMNLYKATLNTMQDRMIKKGWSKNETAFLSPDQKLADLNMDTWRESARIGKTGKNAGVIRSARAKLWKESNEERAKIQADFSNQLLANEAFTNRINNYIKDSAGKKSQKMLHSWLVALETTDNWTPGKSEAFIKRFYGGDEMYNTIFRARSRYDKTLEQLRKKATKNGLDSPEAKVANEFATLLDNWKTSPNFAERVRLERELDAHFKYNLHLTQKLPKGAKVIPDAQVYETQRAAEVADIGDFIEERSKIEAELGETIADLSHEVSRLEEEIASMKSAPYGSVKGAREARKQLNELGSKPPGKLEKVPPQPEPNLRFQNLTDPGTAPQPIVPISKPIAPNNTDFPYGSLSEEEFAAKLADHERIIKEAADTIDVKLVELRKSLNDTYKRVAPVVRQYERIFDKYAQKVIPSEGGMENAAKVLEATRNKLRTLSAERDRLKSPFQAQTPERLQRLQEIEGEIYAEIDNARNFAKNPNVATPAPDPQVAHDLKVVADYLSKGAKQRKWISITVGSDMAHALERLGVDLPTITNKGIPGDGRSILYDLREIKTAVDQLEVPKDATAKVGETVSRTPDQQAELERLMSSQGMTVDEMNRLDELTQKAQGPAPVGKRSSLTTKEQAELRSLDAKLRKGERGLYAPEMGDFPVEPQGGLLGEAIENQQMVDLDPTELVNAMTEYADFIEAEQHVRDTADAVSEAKAMLAELQDDRKALGERFVRRAPEERVAEVRPWSPESTEAQLAANEQQPVRVTKADKSTTVETPSGRPITDTASTTRRYAERRTGKLKTDLDAMKAQRERELSTYRKELDDFRTRYDRAQERLAEHQSSPKYKAYKKRVNIRNMQEKSNLPGWLRYDADMVVYLTMYGDAIERNKEWKAALARWGKAHAKWEGELNKWQGMIDTFQVRKQTSIDQLNTMKEHIRIAHSQLGFESQMNRNRYLERFRKIDDLDQKIAHAKGFSVVDSKGRVITSGHSTASLAESEAIIKTNKDLGETFLDPNAGGDKNFSAKFEAELFKDGLPPRPDPNSSIEEKMLWHLKVNMAQDLHKTASEAAWMLTPKAVDNAHNTADRQVDELLESIRNMDKNPDIRPDTQQQVNDWVDAIRQDVEAIPEWDRQKLREAKVTALGNMAADARKAYTQYDDQTVFDFAMQKIFPFWMYETRRFGRLYNNFERHPWTLRTMLNYYDSTDRGYVEIGNTGYHFRPDAGTLWTGGGLLDPRATYTSMPGMLGAGEEVMNGYEKLGLFSPIMDTAISGANALVNRDVRLMSDTILSATGFQNPVNASVMMGEPLPGIGKTMPGGKMLSELATDFRDMLGDHWNTYNVDIWLGDKGYNADEVRAAADLGEKIAPVNRPFEEIDARELLASANRYIAMRTMGMDLLGAAIYRSPNRRKHEEARKNLIMEKFGLSEEDYEELRKAGGLRDKIESQPKFKEELGFIPGANIWNRSANVAFAPADEQAIRQTVDRFYRTLRANRSKLNNSQLGDDAKLKMPTSDYTHAKWIEDHRQRQIELAALPYVMRDSGSMYASKDITSHGVPITSDEWAEYRTRLNSEYTKEGLSPLDTILNDYYKISPMEPRFQKISNIDGFETKETDWLAYYAAKDRILNNIPENEAELKQAVIYTINKNKTDTEKEFEKAAHAYSMYNTIKKYEFMTEEQGKKYDEAKLLMQDLNLKLKHQKGHKLSEIQRWTWELTDLNLKWSGVDTTESQERIAFKDSADGRLMATWFFQQEPRGPRVIK